jgi:LL-diaminopimelate aminotransferase
MAQTRFNVPNPAARLSALPPYPFALLTQRVRELNAQGYDVINLDIGSPDMPPPDDVVAMLYESARIPSHHGYAGYRGTTRFRAAIVDYYARRFGIELDREREVLPLIGSKEGIVNLSLAYLDRGDIALVPNVGYPAYSMGAYLAGAEVYWLPVSEPDYLPNVDDIPSAALERSKLLWVNYPNNPTGAAADLSFYRKMVDFCLERDIVLASDNPYVDVTYDGYVAPSALEVDGARDCAVEFISFSKTYNMAGWRLGAAVGCADALNNLLQVKSNIDSGHFHAIYDAGITAERETTPEWIAERNTIYQRRRDRVLAALPGIGLRAHQPKGSLYVWARVEDETMDGGVYAGQALLNAHVSIAPGEIYGPGGTQYVRISISIHDQRLEEGLERLKVWYAKR